MDRGPTLGACLHTGPTPDYPHGRVRPRTDFDVDHVKRMQKEGRLKSSLPSERVGYPEKDTRYVFSDMAEKVMSMLCFLQGRHLRQTEPVLEASALRRYYSSVVNKREVRVYCATPAKLKLMPLFRAAQYLDAPLHSHRCLVSGDDPALLPHTEISSVPLQR